MAEEKKDAPPPAKDAPPPAGKDAPPPAGDKKDTPPPGDKKDAAPPADDKKGDDHKTPEGKADEKPGDKDGSPDADKPKVPEKYQLAPPEGSAIDEDDLTQVAAVARQNGWTNEQAQAFVDAHAATVTSQRATFLAQVEADPTYGGERLSQTQRHALLFLDKMRPKGTARGDALRALLNKSGYGDHLEVISLFADVGRLMAEDSGIGAPRSSDAKAPQDPVTALYGTKYAATG